MDEYRKIVITEIATILKPLGFKKYGTNAVRELPHVYQVVNLQSSQWGTSEHLRACINVGVFFKSTLLGGEIKASSVKAYKCHWQARFVSPDPTVYDKWWVAESDEEAHAIAREICALLRDHAIPLFERLQALSDIEAVGSPEGFHKPMVSYGLLNNPAHLAYLAAE